MEPAPVDVSHILRDIETEIAEAEQRAQEANRRVEYLRGQRDGILLVIRASQRPPAIITEGEEGKE